MINLAIPGGKAGTPRTAGDQARRLAEQENVDILVDHKVQVRPCFIEAETGTKASTVCKFLARYERRHELSPEKEDPFPPRSSTKSSTNSGAHFQLGVRFVSSLKENR
jgi:hypothetical protein